MKQKISAGKCFTAVLMFLMLTIPFNEAFGQKRNKLYEDYIKQYQSLAVEHMKKHKIPASITLAQGILESGAGMGDLARRSNNHFGIKCHSDWKGKRVYAKDDRPNDCFRSYNKVADSYEDHSQFLKKARYSSLFKLDITDYRGWARGLQTCGYATDKAYANKLIKLIEDYELYQYDRKGNWKKIEKEVSQIVDGPRYKHQPLVTHGLLYVKALQNDTYEAIAVEFGFKLKDLYKWNEVPEGFPLQPGDIVYFEKKKKKADKPYYEYVVKVGDSMHSISQLYGVKVKNLYKMNKLDDEYIPTEGDVLKLR